MSGILIPFDTTTLAVTIIGLLYALTGYYEGVKKGESFDAVAFVKTILLALVTGGVISQSGADQILGQLTPLLGTGPFLLVDQQLNQLIRGSRPSPPAPPPATVPAP
jgi:hypothetical protein